MSPDLPIPIASFRKIIPTHTYPNPSQASDRNTYYTPSQAPDHLLDPIASVTRTYPYQSQVFGMMPVRLFTDAAIYL